MKKIKIPKMNSTVKIQDQDQGQGEIRIVPILPLHTVLYPGMEMSLYLAEEDQKKMVFDCLKVHQPFGVVLARPKKEGQAPYAIFGTMAEIEEAHGAGPQGELRVRVTGTRRFRFLESKGSAPYLTAEVGLRTEILGQKHLALRLARETQLAFDNYLKVCSLLIGASVPNASYPKDPLNFSYWIAQVLPLMEDQRQDLLEIHATQQRLEKELELLDWENRKLMFISMQKQIVLN